MNTVANILTVMNPATDQILAQLPCDDLASLQKKYQEAHTAQTHWAQKSVKERLTIIEKFSNLLLEKKDYLAEILTKEVGKPLQESKNEVNGAVKKIQFFLKNSEQLLAQKEVNVDGNTREVISYDPLGVIANISAWNYPYLVGINIFIPALITGNAVLYKPSEFAALTGQEIADMMKEAGVPKGVFHLVLGAGNIGQELLNLPLNGVYFTGSYATGKKIAEKVQGRMLPMILELGGKDPLYVRDDVKDLNAVAEAIVEGCFYNNGQSCCAVERVYLHKNVYDKILPLIVEKTKNLKVGDPFDGQHQQGAITRPVHLSFLQKQVDEAVKLGATLLCGGKKKEGPGAFYLPTILTNVTHQMSVMRDESFGPVRGVMKVDNDQQAIELMNDTPYGLTAAIYSSDVKKAEELLKKVNAGTSYINCCDRVSAYLPWSGRKQSGFGSSLSMHGLYAFTHPRGIHLRSLA